MPLDGRYLGTCGPRVERNSKYTKAYSIVGRCAYSNLCECCSKMKFIFADSLDTVDPGYNFLTDRYASSRAMHWDDQYPHELMETPPYDGVLVSRAVVGDQRSGGKYTPAQAMRFRREGARRFLRMDTPK